MALPNGFAKARLLRRAQLVARQHHVNLARLLPLPGGAGMVPVTEGAKRLADYVRGGLPFASVTLEQAVWLLLDVLSGLRALHELSFEGEPFVHGAVSPQHVLVGEPGEARLIPIVNAHVIPGTPLDRNGYAAPELLLGGVVDARADVFSVGVLLWEALAQQRLFADPSREAVSARLRADSSRPLPPVGAAWAAPLCQVAQRAIRLTPDERFDSALDMSLAIVAAVGQHLTGPACAAWPAPPSPDSNASRTTSIAEAISGMASLSMLPPPPLEPQPLRLPVPPPPPRPRNLTPMATVINLPPPPSESSVATRVSELAPLARTSGAAARLGRHARWLPLALGVLALPLWLLRKPVPSPSAAPPIAAAAAEVATLAAPPNSAATAPAPSLSAAVVKAPKKRAAPARRPADSDYGI